MWEHHAHPHTNKFSRKKKNQKQLALCICKWSCRKRNAKHEYSYGSSRENVLANVSARTKISSGSSVYSFYMIKETENGGERTILLQTRRITFSRQKHTHIPTEADLCILFYFLCIFFIYGSQFSSQIWNISVHEVNARDCGTNIITYVSAHFITYFSYMFAVCFWVRVAFNGMW